MRVLLHQGRVPLQLSLLTDTSKADVMVLVDNGKLAVLPDGCIAEPVEVFDNDEESAHAYREVLRRKHPAEDFRVVAQSDVPL